MALSSGKCTCPVHDPIPTSGWRSVGVMIQSPHKDTMDQAVQTSFDYDDEPTGAGTEMDRSHLERAEYNLLETKNSSFKFQPMYSSPSDQPRFVIEIDGEDFTEHERSQEAHEPASSMEFATQTEIVSVVQWGFDGQRDNGQDLISEPVPTESKFPKVYEDCNYQCEFVFEVEPEDPAELTKISNLAHFDDSLPEKEPVADPHIGLSSSKTERIEAQVMESEISPFEILKVYETHSKKINAILVFEDSQKENTLETVTILENKKIATAESYLLQEESNKGGILMLNEETKEKHEIDKLPEEHITFAKTEPLELKAVPYILSYFLPETHFPELRSRVHVTEIQKIEAHMFLKELAYDEVKEVSRDEDLNIDPRKSQNQIDFSYFVHLTSHTNYNVQYSSLYSKPEDGKEDLFDISQDERKDLDGVYVTSPKDIKTVTSMQYDKVEEKRYFKLGVVLPDVKSDPEKNRAENTFVDMNSNHQVKTDTALPSTSNNERNNFKSDIITAHPKDLNYPNHFLKSEFHLQKEEVQTFKKIMFSQKNIKENRKIRSNLHEIAATPVSRIIQEKHNQEQINSEQIKPHTNQLKNERPRDVMPSFMGINSPPLPKHHTSIKNSFRASHSKGKGVSHADVPSHGGVFLAGKDHVAIFSQTKVREPQPIKHEELPSDSVSPDYIVSQSTEVTPVHTSSQSYNTASTLQYPQTSSVAMSNDSTSQTVPSHHEVPIFPEHSSSQSHYNASTQTSPLIDDFTPQSAPSNAEVLTFPEHSSSQSYYTTSTHSSQTSLFVTSDVSTSQTAPSHIDGSTFPVHSYSQSYYSARTRQYPQTSSITSNDSASQTAPSHIDGSTFPVHSYAQSYHTARTHKYPQTSSIVTSNDSTRQTAPGRVDVSILPVHPYSQSHYTGSAHYLKSSQFIASNDPTSQSAHGQAKVPPVHPSSRSRDTANRRRYPQTRKPGVNIDSVASQSDLGNDAGPNVTVHASSLSSYAASRRRYLQTRKVVADKKRAEPKDPSARSTRAHDAAFGSSAPRCLGTDRSGFEALSSLRSGITRPPAVSRRRLLAGASCQPSSAAQETPRRSVTTHHYCHLPFNHSFVNPGVGPPGLTAHSQCPRHYMTQYIVREFFTFPVMVTLYRRQVYEFPFIWKLANVTKISAAAGWPGKLVSAPRRDDPGDWCHCKEQCRFVSAVDNTCLCSCEECSARRRRERPLQTSKSQRDKGVQVPSLENMAVQTAPSATVWEPPARPARQEPALLPQLTVSAESTAAARHRPPPHDHGDHGGARAQLQFLMPPREGWGAPRSVPVRDFNVVFMPGADESMEDAPEAQPMGYAHWRRRVRSEMVHQPCQVECHFWMLYIIAAVVLATVLLCLAAWLRESAGDYRSSEFVKGGLFRALVVAACALVILLAFYVMWLGSHVDQLRALRLVVVASVVGLVFFTALGVATLLLGPESPVYAVFLFLLAAVFLAACLHSACARRLAAR